MYKEEMILRQKRAELEGFAAYQRLLKEARLEKPLGLRHRLAITLLNAARRLEPDLVRPKEANC